MRTTLLALFVCVLSATGQASAHEVHASTVKIVVEDEHLEVLQTTPLNTARTIAGELSGSSPGAEDYTAMLDAIATGWAVSGEQSVCALDRQAYRLAHHDTQLQARYLFKCDGAQSPVTLAAPWLMQAPDDHFIILELNMDGKTKTVIFQRQPLVIDLKGGA